VHRFLGLSLGGGKTNKTCLSVLEYYPSQNKIFLKEINEKIKSENLNSSDQILFNLIEEYKNAVEYLAFDVPLELPKCIKCNLKCPGYESCTEPEIKWLKKSYEEKNQKKKPLKLFTPYTERCVEAYLSDQLEEVFHVPHALGSNSAPLTARAIYLKRRIKIACIEVYPKLSLWRIGTSLGIQKSYLRFHKHAISGEEIREAILKRLVEENIAFLYAQDVKTLISNSHAFDSFICGMTAVLKFKDQVDKRPKGFPKEESWIEIPKLKLEW
jgi:hypothetical protein